MSNEISNNSKCIECGLECKTQSSLSAHLQHHHKIKSKDYVIKHYYGGVEPTCTFEACVRPTRYVSLNGDRSFKRYCSQHAREAMKEGGIIGGTKPSWNKGKTKYDDIRVYNQSIAMSGAFNHFLGKQHLDSSKKKIAAQKLITQPEFENRINLREKDFQCCTSYEEYHSRQYTKLKFRCLTCNNIQEKTLQSYERGSLCKFCYPRCVSQAEIEIGNYIQNEIGLKIVRNTRDVIPPMELDIYIPHAKVAIEYNGLFWHDAQKIGKHYHKDKTEKCRAAGINLIHIYSDEWETNKELLKSMLAARVGKTKHKINGRSCTIKEIDTKLTRQFFDNNHVSGYTKCSKAFGLFDSTNELVSCMSFRQPNQKSEWLAANKHIIELARYANKQHTTVRGGFTKLLRHAIDKWLQPYTDYTCLWSYCDTGHGTGNVYQKAGFVLSERKVSMNYWYTDGKKRYNRFKFRACNGLSEKEVAKNNKVWKVYGSGNRLYVYNFR